jgi:hypothetical protein
MPQSTAVELGESPMSTTRFWSEFVPSVFDALLIPGRRAA